MEEQRQRNPFSNLSKQRLRLQSYPRLFWGKATCTEKAVCAVCGAKYGHKSKTNHTALKKVDAVAATASKSGNIEYWYCSACGKYFSDSKGTKNISKGDTVINKQAPKITGGNDVKWKKSSSDTLKFRSDADIADFVCVLVDNNVISPTYYTKSEGSTIIELKSSYLDTLSAGKHTLTIRSTTGDAVATFYRGETDHNNSGDYADNHNRHNPGDYAGNHGSNNRFYALHNRADNYRIHNARVHYKGKAHH